MHLTSLPLVIAEWKDEKLAKRWKQLLKIRTVVTKALEEARVRKLIGHSLDAAVTIYAEEEQYDVLFPYEDDLRTVFIVSQAALVKGSKPPAAFESDDINGVSILVEPATGDKCERCWIHDTSVGTNLEKSTICGRCQDAMAQIL